MRIYYDSYKELRYSLRHVEKISAMGGEDCSIREMGLGQRDLLTRASPRAACRGECQGGSAVPGKVGSVLTVAVSVFTLSIFLAPFTVERGSLTGLRGRANWVDYHGLWTETPLYAGAIYWIGDLGCHQSHGRPFVLNGNQLPVCARCTGVYVGLSLGLVLLSLLQAGRMGAAWSGLVPDRLRGVRRRVLLILLCGGLVAPAGADGLLQLLTEHESHNVVRVLTGIPLGVAGSVLVGAFILGGLWEEGPG
jgi:uncharacterized membrane protein